MFYREASSNETTISVGLNFASAARFRSRLGKLIGARVEPCAVSRVPLRHQAFEFKANRRAKFTPFRKSHPTGRARSRLHRFAAGSILRVNVLGLTTEVY